MQFVECNISLNANLLTKIFHFVKCREDSDELLHIKVQLVVFTVPDDGIPQTFIKRVDDYTEVLKEAIQNFSLYKQKRAA